MSTLFLLSIFYLNIVNYSECVAPLLIKSGSSIDDNTRPNQNNANVEEVYVPYDVLRANRSLPDASRCNESLEQNCEQMVVSYLFDVYSKVPRPVQNDSWITPVQLNPGFISMLELEQKSQTLSLNLWMRFYWYDYYLMWDPTDFGGKTKVKVPISYVWMPDIVLYQELGKTEPMRTEMRRVVISNDGKVSLLYPAVHRIFCPLQMRRFPFDTQSCELRFGTWFHKAHEIVMKPKSDEGDIRFFQTNSEWKLIGVDVIAEFITYLTDPISEVAYTLHIKRHPTFYICTLVIPTSFIMVVSIIGLFSPSKSHDEREEKISMGITTLLTLALLLLMIADQMPKSANEIPLIAVFFMLQLLICVVSSLCTVVMIHLQRQSMWLIEPSKRLKTFCRLFGRLKTDGNDVTLVEPEMFKETVKINNVALISDNYLNANHKNGNVVQNGITTTDRKEERRRKREEAIRREEERQERIKMEWVDVCDRLDEFLKWGFLTLSLLALVWLIIAGHADMY